MPPDAALDPVLIDADLADPPMAPSPTSTQVDVDVKRDQIRFLLIWVFMMICVLVEKPQDRLLLCIIWLQWVVLLLG